MIAADVLQMVSGYQQSQAGIASRTAGYQRRADDWRLQANLAAHELVAIGEQVLASLIAEQIAYHDYTTTKAQVKQAQDIQAFLQSKFTSAVFTTGCRAISPTLLSVLSIRVRYGKEGRADHETGVDAA